jgi:HEPN domain-containing protein
LAPLRFIASQAAEKMAKSVLIALRQPPPKQHDIEELGRRVRAHHAALGEAFGEFAGLTRWYVSARYPDAGVDEEPTREEVREVLARLHELRRRVHELAPE